ncbi:DNA helicase B-like [Lineus longissimus]|uniref:DNA helicase B-like n=1 Tax=Lineus longissimus TaxID=88925 RepID=UPI002B4F9B11
METEIVSGYFVVDKTTAQNDDGDGSDADSGDDEASFLDADEETGGQPFGLKPVRKRTALFQEIKSSGKLGNKFNVIGRIQLVDPWWKVKMEIRKTKQPVKYLMGHPEYSLRDDGGVFAEKLVPMFLQSIECHEQMKQNFYDYLRNQGLFDKLSFTNLMELLEKFCDSSEEAKKTGHDLIETVKYGGQLVLRSMVYTQLFRYLPRLVPKHFVIMIETSKELDLIALEDAIYNAPYVFGFAPILRTKYHQDNNVEASLETMMKTGLFKKISICHKDALVIYNTMKHDSRKNGHTYSRKMDLDQCSYLQDLDHEITRWDLPIQFLIDKSVIKKEIHVPYSYYFLLRLWKCENGISDNLLELMERHEEKPYTFDVDFESEEFEGVRRDPDQMKVAEAIGKHPIVVISGKGGCGKTTTVSATLNYAKRLKSEEFNVRRKMFDESEEMDDMALSQQVSEMERTVSNIGGQCMPPGEEKGNESRNSASNDDVEGGEEEEDSDSKEDGLLNILLAAPTGKAASVLKRRSHLDACTLHTVKVSYSFWTKSRVGPWRFAGVEVLVVDESSMVSVSIFHDVLDILMKESKLSKIILLGDIKQLPSIDSGNFLADVFAAFKSVGVSIELRTNHRSESQLIVDNATRISNQVMPEFNSQLNFHHVLYEKGRGEIAGAKGQVDKDEDASCELDALVKKLLHREECLKCDKTSQMISFKRTTCANINEICCKTYNKHTTRTSKNKLDFQIGDKIACNQNGNVTNYLEVIKPPDDATNGDDVEIPIPGNKANEPSASGIRKRVSGQNKAGGAHCEANKEGDKKKDAKKDDSVVRLCNGEIYFIKEDCELQEQGKHMRYIHLDDDFQQVKVNFKEVKIKCKIRHAWANTIHKFQGSEAETIVYIVSSSLYENWQHVYTAVTRGKKHLYILSRPGQLEAAIKRPARYRRTTLKEKIKKKMEEYGINDATVFMQSALMSPTQTQFPKRLVPQKVADDSVAVNVEIFGADTHSKGGACGVDDSDLAAVKPTASSSSLMEPLASSNAHGSTAMGGLPKTFHFTSLNNKFVNSAGLNSAMETGANSFRDDSQTFSEWGDSMVEEINAIVEATQTSSAPNSDWMEESSPSLTLKPEPNSDQVKVACHVPCKELFPPDMNLERGDFNYEYEDENPIPFDFVCKTRDLPFIASPCESFVTTVVIPRNQQKSVPKGSSYLDRNSKDLVQNLVTPPLQGPPALQMSSDLGPISKDAVQNPVTPVHQRLTCMSDMSPELFSPGSPDLVGRNSSPINGASSTTCNLTPDLSVLVGNQNVLVSPKRPGCPLDNVMRSPKVRKLAAYGGFCDNCLSPIRRGVDMITIEETPKRHWVHEQCSPNKDN